ncbi:MAG: aminomethyl transferase family protein [Rhodospirillales bacterium]|nr:aminomethyl transferase family protein [Rhodospirillales bacterium]
MGKPAEPRLLRHTPEIPFDPDIGTYTIFPARGGSYEPYEYTGWIDESLSWKETCYIGDWSPLNKFQVKGPQALHFFSDVAVNSLAKFEVGQAKHLVLCNADGKVVTEGVCMRYGAEELVYSAGTIHWPAFQFERGNYRAEARWLEREEFIIQVQGPTALFVLEKAAGESLRDIGFMRFRKGRIAGRAVTILRQGMSGDIGFELHGPSADALATHQAILDAGREFGIRRLGGRAKMVNHVEACFPTPSVDFIPAVYGEENYFAWMRTKYPGFSGRRMATAGSFESDDIRAYYRSPVELGWMKNIKFDHAFIGSAALEAEVARPKRVMTTLVWNAEDVIDVYASLFQGGAPFDYMEMPRALLNRMEADQVMKDGRLVGVSTSRCYSHFFRQMLSLCTLDVGSAALGTEVAVVWGRPGGPQKTIRATVAPAPYKSDRRRTDLSALPPYRG